jgi:hypothetical protein
MFRFTTRDLLWLTVMVALAIGWWLESRSASQMRGENLMLRRSHEMMRYGIEVLESEHDAVVRNLPRTEPIYTDEEPLIRDVQAPTSARSDE